MPIEFRCPGCGKLLRTADETAGKQAKCPQCGAVMTIAMGSMGPAPQSPAGPANYPDPNQASQSYSPGPAEAGGVPPPPQLEVGDIFGRTWAIFKSEMGMCIAVVLVVVFINILANAFLGVATKGLEQGHRGDPTARCWASSANL